MTWRSVRDDPPPRDTIMAVTQSSFSEPFIMYLNLEGNWYRFGRSKELDQLWVAWGAPDQWMPLDKP
jgi:hypothetical protein